METEESGRVPAPGRRGWPPLLPLSSLLIPSLLLSVFLGSSCTFERRPPPGEGEAGEELLLPSPEGSARAFLEDLGEARTAGRAADLRVLLHPEAEILVDGRSLAFDGDGDLRADSAAWSVLAPGAGDAGGAGGGEGERREVAAAVLGEAALFLYREPAATEAFLLSRDSTGWRLRLLHRSTIEMDGGES